MLIILFLLRILLIVKEGNVKLHDQILSIVV
jgi:hypothetical protein